MFTQKKICEPERAIGARRGRSIPNRTQENFNHEHRRASLRAAVMLGVPPCLRACCVCACVPLSVRVLPPSCACVPPSCACLSPRALVRAATVCVRAAIRVCAPAPYACVPPFVRACHFESRTRTGKAKRAETLARPRAFCAIFVRAL